eukprot:TRINITY_DN9176_c0_g1_i2.p1 TRINITY_DN9176_c0_g1~~TRINITY_DN9176_c0_g1_i2.p1  ORF type:complete len:397 (-),score=62.46 TRINITY_DN9176_c0_g1_i2:370-1560(-)
MPQDSSTIGCKPYSSSEQFVIDSRAADVRDVAGGCDASTCNKADAFSDKMLDETCQSDAGFHHRQRRNSDCHSRETWSFLSPACSDDEAQSDLGCESWLSDASTSVTLSRHTSSTRMTRKLRGSSLSFAASTTNISSMQYSSMDMTCSLGADPKDPLNESNFRSVFPLHESEDSVVRRSKDGDSEEDAPRSRRLVERQALPSLSEICITPDICAALIRDVSSERSSTDEFAREGEDSYSALLLKGSLQEDNSQQPVLPSFPNERMEELDRNRQMFREESEEHSFDLCADFVRQSIEERSHVRVSRNPLRARMRSSAVQSEASSTKSDDLCGPASMDFSFQNMSAAGGGWLAQPKKVGDEEVPFWMLSEDALDELERNRERFSESSDACSVSSLFED